VQHHPPSHEATPQEGTASMHPNTVHFWYSHPQPEHPPVQQYAHPLSHTNCWSSSSQLSGLHPSGS